MNQPNEKRFDRSGITILGVPFDKVTMAQTLARIEDMIRSRQPHYVVTANVDFVVQAQTDVELRRIFLDAHLVLCDGTPLVWASRVLGNPLPERVAGADLVPRLIEVAAQKGYRIFLLGATPDSAAQAVANLSSRFPNLNLAGHYSPPFNQLLEMDHDEIRRRIQAAQPDLLFVSLGCPKQEKWIAMHYRDLGVPVSIGVGATIDFLAQKVKRAPVWMQRSGTEWCFRLLQEPRRLMGRYATDFAVFGRRIFIQACRLRRESAIPRQEALPAIGVRGKCLLISAPPWLDAQAVHEGRVPVDLVLADHRHCLLDLSRVRLIDSTGVNLLIRLHTGLRAGGPRDLVLVNPSLAVRRALRIMKLDEFFACAPDLASAVQLLEDRCREQFGFCVGGDFSPGPLRWQGEITAANASKIWEETSQQITDLRFSLVDKLSIDLSGVRFLDSTGLGLMIKLKKLALSYGKELTFENPQANVRNVLSLSRMHHLAVPNQPAPARLATGASKL